MTIRCSICNRLSLDKQEAIAEAFRAGVSLDNLSAQTGLSRSSLWRHGRHAIEQIALKHIKRPWLWVYRRQPRLLWP